jgi:DNA-binding transcriptional LysR family regulator
VLRPRGLRPPDWIGVDFRHLVALEAVASESSFNRAAVRLGYTQSAISQQIATLERVIGERLIERPGGAQPVRLTRAGEIVMEHAHAIHARLAAAHADLQALAAGDLDPLRVGFFGHGLGALMPGIARELQAARPEIDIRIVESGDSDDLAGMLRRGEADVSFIQLPLKGGELEQITLLEDEYVLAVHSDSPAARPGRATTLDDLTTLELIGLKQKPCQLTDYFHAHNLEPTWVVGSNDIETIYAFVAAGLGAALLPRLATLSLGPGVTIVELDCGLPARRVGLAWSRSRRQSESAAAFVRAAKCEAAKVSQTRRLTVAS